MIAIRMSLSQSMEEEYFDYDEKELNFTFKQMRKVALGDEISQYNFTKGDKLSLLCCSKLYGLVFISKRTGFLVFPTDALVQCHETNFSQPLNQVIPAQYSGIQTKLIELGSSPFLLSLNADNSVLICLFRNAGNLITAAFYDVTNLGLEVPPCQPNTVLSLSKDPNVLLIDFQWNPTKPDTYALCFSNGECLSYQFSLPQNLRAFPPLNNKTASICWSPKGKHLAIGTSEGIIEQYSCEKDQFQFVKKHPQISNLASLQTKVVHLKWLSTYLFAIVYSLLTDSGETDQILVLKHAKKAEKTVIVNFSDVYVQSDNSPTFYFSEIFPQQRILITTTGLANEVFVLANQTDLQNPREWFLAILDDTNRADLPLEGVEETFPMGLAIDSTSQAPIPTDKEPLPPHPILLLLTTKGVLCPFHVIYENMQSLIEPAKQLKSSKQPLNPSQLIKAQTGNPQDVPKNPSTTTVTVMGGNKPYTAKSPTFVLTQEHPGQEQIVGPDTESMPGKTSGITPTLPTVSIPPGQGSIFKTAVQPLTPGIFGVPSALQQQQQQQQQQGIFKIPNLIEKSQNNPPSTLQIPNNQMGTTNSSFIGSGQPAIFNISPNQTTILKSDQVPKQAINIPQSQPFPKPSLPESTVNPQILDKTSTNQVPTTNTRVQPQIQAPSSISSTNIITPTTVTPDLTHKTPQQTLAPNQPPSSMVQPVNSNTNVIPKVVSFEPQKQVASTVSAPKIAAQNVPQMPQSSHPQAKPISMPSSIINTSPPKILSSKSQLTVPLSIPVTSQQEIEVRYETHIRNEIEEFADDLEQLKSKLRAKFGDFDDAFQGKLKDLVGSVEEKNKMYRDTAKVRQELNALIKAFDEMNQIISTIRNEGFHIQEKIEDANKAKKWISSAKFGFFIATTPLDPISEDKKKNLLQTYSILDQKLQEIETMLLILLNKSNDINDLQAICKTIASHEQIIQNLNGNMDQLTEDIQEFKFERQLSKINISTSCINPYELLTKSLEKHHFDFKVKTNRIVELKEFLCHIPTAQIIKPRNPANQLNISRALNCTKDKIAPLLKVSAKEISKSILNQSDTLTPPNTGYKLLLSPQGDIYVSPTPYALPEGCVSVDASQLNLLTQKSQTIEGIKSSPTKDNVPEKLKPTTDDYTRDSKPKVVVEHRPQTGNKISPPKSSQTEGQNLDNPLRDQRVNRTLDFSTPPKHPGADSFSVTSTPMKPFDESPQNIAPNINLFAGTSPCYGPGPLESLPDYSFNGSPMNPILLPPPGKVPSVTVGYSPKQIFQPQIPSNDPRFKIDPQSDGKSSPDKMLYNLLSTQETTNPSAQTQSSGVGKNKTVNLLNPLHKPPSTLLQSTNPETKSSPLKSSDDPTVKSGSKSTITNLADKPKTDENGPKLSTTQNREMTTNSKSKSNSDLVGQTINIPNPSNLLIRKPEIPSTSLPTVQTDAPNVPQATSASQIKLPTLEQKLPSSQPIIQKDLPKASTDSASVQPGQANVPISEQANVSVGKADLPAEQSSTPNGQANVPTMQANVPTMQANVPTAQANVHAGQANVPAGQANVPTGQVNVPTGGQANVPTGQANTPSGQTDVPTNQIPNFKLNVPLQQGNSPLQQTAQPTQHHTLSTGQNTNSNQSQIAPQSEKETPKPIITSTIDGDSEMQDDAEEGVIQPQQILQGTSFGIGAAQPMTNAPNPFKLPGGPPSGSSISNPFSGGSAQGTNVFTTNPLNQTSAQPPNIFGLAEPNFGATATLFQGRSLLQGFSPQKSNQMGFGQSSESATFGSIAKQTGTFVQPGNPMSQHVFQQPQPQPQPGPNVFGNAATGMSVQGNGMKGKSFTTYRS